MAPFRAGRRRVDGDNGTVQVRTYREGIAQKVGHDLIIDVGRWEAAAEVGEDGTLSAVELDADPRSLRVCEGLHGLKPLTNKDRANINETIDEILGDGRSPSARMRWSPVLADSRSAANSSSQVRGDRRASS